MIHLCDGFPDSPIREPVAVHQVSPRASPSASSVAAFRKPNAVPCFLCGNQFFPASLRFHQKQCRKRQPFVSVQCPHCKFLVPEASYAGHVRECASASNAIDSNQLCREVANDLPISSLNQQVGVVDRINMNLSRHVGETGKDNQDNQDKGSIGAEPERSKCPYCSRGFAVDRIQTHIRICGNLRQARPRGPEGQVTQETICVYDSAAARAAPPLPTDGGIERARKRCFLPRGLYEVRCSTKPSSEATIVRRKNRLVDPEVWRRKHEDFITAVKTARQKGRFGEDVAPRVFVAPRQQDVATVSCPYCARKFAPAIAERHIPKCLYTTNHARKTPSRFGDAIQPPAARPPPLYRKREPEADRWSCADSQVTSKRNSINMGASKDECSAFSSPSTSQPRTSRARRIVGEMSRTMVSFRRDRRGTTSGAASPELQPSSRTNCGVQDWPSPQTSKLTGLALSQRGGNGHGSTPSYSMQRYAVPMSVACGERVLHALTWSSRSRNMERALTPVEDPRHRNSPGPVMSRRPCSRGR
eukprot:gnl/MRDRNA2_/MRDRNA2_122495_c0_seq1.p1 gnl/MRDRNA2_/MRDRNA2_122495_c0~~gnl/MRDRNA2_/MRDRNA2_122495_c0_seq1.p1  ORF type:complete len:530 (+),score=54.94 gnl/MRDRNA2_/MRDRNA2_122495_c0_seq1:95-1684(+)